MKKLYLALAIIGAIVPYVFFFQFVVAEGINIPLFLSLLFANMPAGGFSADLLLATGTFWAFILQQHKAAKGPKPLLFIVLCCTIGLSCALPAYLYANEG